MCNKSLRPSPSMSIGTTFELDSRITPERPPGTAIGTAALNVPA